MKRILGTTMRQFSLGHTRVAGVLVISDMYYAVTVGNLSGTVLISL